jgi:hypothetical protein
VYHSKRTGYLARFRPVLIASSRYLAYTSDVGESFRPVVAPKTVTAAYGISWAYLIGDVVYESWKAKGRASEMAPDHVSQVVGLTCVFFGSQLVPLLDSGRVPSKLTTSVSAPCVFPSASLFSPFRTAHLQFRKARHLPGYSFNAVTVPHDSQHREIHCTLHQEAGHSEHSGPAVVAVRTWVRVLSVLGPPVGPVTSPRPVGLYWKSFPFSLPKLGNPQCGTCG